jgi:hypothetical protein
MGPSRLCRTIVAYTGLSTYIGHMLDMRPGGAGYVIDIIGVPKGIRTPVTAVKELQLHLYGCRGTDLNI